MRVYHLIKGLGRGGAEMLLPEVIRATPRADAAFRVGYFLPHKDALVSTLEHLQTPVVCFEGSRNAQIVAKSAQVARDASRWGADVIHCHLPVTGATGRLAGTLAGIPVVYTEHNLQERYHRATAMLNRSTWTLQTRAIACSEEVKRSIEQHIGTRVPVTTVLNGVSLDRFAPDPPLRASMRERLGIPLDAPVMGTVAVFRDQKRLPEWLALAASVRDARPDARFLLIGDGPLRAEVEAAIAHHRLADHVLLPGLQEDVRPWLQAMDLYVMSSKFEGLPVALLEAMASGLVPVCSAVGGIPQVIEQDRSGHCVPPEDVGALREPILQLFDDPDRRGQMALAARARVAERFSVDEMSKQLLTIYREVCDG